MYHAVLPGGAIDTLMKRNFAPAAERLQSVVARLKGIPALIDAMKANIHNPPREFTDIAILMAGGSVGFFQRAIAQWAKESAGSDAALLKRFETANAAAVMSLQAGTAWLKSELLPRSKGNYAIGPELYARALLYEMIDLPLTVLAIGEANLEKDYQAFLAAAKEIDRRPRRWRWCAGSRTSIPRSRRDRGDKKTIEATRQFLIDRKITVVRGRRRS
jgi:hypothetical protein